MHVSIKSPNFVSSRGARFLDLVKANKLTVSPQLTRRFSLNEMKRDEKLKSESKTKDYLKFNSCNPFNPEASPSSSILSKRKAEADSSPLTSSSAKRKRVGFRDPVSSTKEYLITDEEEKLKQSSLIRCLNYENSENDEVDEIEELAIINKEIKQERKFEEESIPEPMLDHDYEELGAFGSPQNTDISTSSDDSVEQFSFKNKHELMAYISKNLTVDEIFEQLTKAEEASVKRKELIGKVVKTVGFKEFLGEYFTVSESQETKLSVEQNEVITTVLSEVSSLMSTNLNVRHKVLDVLSEKHSREFLDHALQENSTAKVCDTLTLPSITNYIIHKVNSSDNESNADDINRMNRAILQKLITSTNSNGKEIISNRNETQDMMKLLFRNKPKIDIFDTVHEFLRNIVQNH